MKKSTVLYLISGVILIWFTFIWCKYHIFYKNYSQEEINEIFESTDITPPIYKTINIEGYHVSYLTNRKNDYITADIYGVKAPYLFLSHDSGYNSSYFIEYFKNKDINHLFHIIAVDRIGFGKTRPIPHDDFSVNQVKPEVEEFEGNMEYISGIIGDKILDAENQHLDEVRMVNHGASAILGVRYLFEYPLSVVKQFMFQPEIKPRLLVSKYYSKLIANTIFHHIFPRPYVNKHKDLLFLDKMKTKEDIQKYMQSAVRIENEFIHNYGYMNEIRAFFIETNSNSELDYINSFINSNENFMLKKASSENIFDSPDYYLQRILEADEYTPSFNRIIKHNFGMK